MMRTSYVCVQCGELWHADIGAHYERRCITCRTYRWRRARDEYQACGHVHLTREVLAPECGTYLTLCTCRDCGHTWTEVRHAEPAHSCDARKTRHGLRALGVWRENH